MPTLIIQLPGGATNRIQSSTEFADAVYPGKWTMAPADQQAPDPVVPRQRKLTHLAFLNRLTPTERKTLRTKAKTDDDVADFMDLFYQAKEINLDDPMMQAQVPVLLGSAARANAVLGPDANPSEWP